MSRRLSDGSKEHVRGSDVRAVYVDVSTNRCMNFWFAKDLLDQFHPVKGD